MQSRSFRFGGYLIVVLFALFVFVINEKLALMVVGGVGIIVLVLGLIKYTLIRFEKTRSDER